ncbi:neuroendocrine convertase 2-like [Rhagoletis pomonella]|uniref:neuroendocrine convertase 2-like n=1 Tax=Rhagoletis pomonella TaxID=28610 RepID=UPI001783A4DF|nr:neuroendocrine convertase 2-like [Rhagoletis pomonella]
MVFAAWCNPSGLQMFLICSLILVFAINLPTIAATSGNSAHATLNGRNDVFTSSFLVRFRRSVDNGFAGEVAARYGFDNIGPLVGGNGNEYHFKHKTLPHARTRRSITHTRLLKSHPLVHTAIQQPGFKRVKRGLRPAIPAIHGLKFDATYSVQPIGVEPTDPYFPLQWYLKNTGQNGGKMRLDLNVQAAWDQGITGKNVTTAIMDDGVDYMHPDLKFNYNAEASYDFSSNDPFPYPRYTDDWFNR